MLTCGIPGSGKPERSASDGAGSWAGAVDIIRVNSLAASGAPGADAADGRENTCVALPPADSCGGAAGGAAGAVGTPNIRVKLPGSEDGAGGGGAAGGGVVGNSGPGGIAGPRWPA